MSLVSVITELHNADDCESWGIVMKNLQARHNFSHIQPSLKPWDTDLPAKM